MGLNNSRNSAVESNHKHGSSNPNFCASYGQGLTTNQLSYTNLSEANALESRKPQESCKPQVDPAHGFYSAKNSWTTSGQVPMYSPYLMPTPSITSEVKPWEIMSTPTSVKSVGASRRNAKPIDDSHAHPHQCLHSQCLAISQSHNTVRLRTSLFSSS